MRIACGRFDGADRTNSRRVFRLEHDCCFEATARFRNLARLLKRDAEADPRQRGGRLERDRCFVMPDRVVVAVQSPQRRAEIDLSCCKAGAQRRRLLEMPERFRWRARAANALPKFV
jgi:hypothetical protein